jgi:hypothetical protein
MYNIVPLLLTKFRRGYSKCGWCDKWITKSPPNFRYMLRWFCSEACAARYWPHREAEDHGANS